MPITEITAKSIVRKHKRIESWFVTRYGMNLYRSVLDENDRVVVMLDHIDQLMRQRGNTSPYGFAAHSITHLEVPLSSMRFEIPGIKGVGPRVHKTILEILDTGRSRLLSELMNEE